MTQPADAQAADAQPWAQPAATDDTPWARPAAKSDPLTSRARQLVRDLPSWEPLPPGEVLVRRHARD